MNIGKVEKLLENLHDKKEYFILHKGCKTSIKSWIIIEKRYIVIKFNQKVWLKPYLDMNTE